MRALSRGIYPWGLTTRPLSDDNLLYPPILVKEKSIYSNHSTIRIRLIGRPPVINHPPRIRPGDIEHAIMPRSHRQPWPLLQHRSHPSEWAQGRPGHTIGNLISRVAVAVFRPHHVVNAATLKDLDALNVGRGGCDVLEGCIVREGTEGDHGGIKEGYIGGCAAKVEIERAIRVLENGWIHRIAAVDETGNETMAKSVFIWTLAIV